MREIRLYSSEGGAPGTTGRPYPYHGSRVVRCRPVDASLALEGS